MDYGSFISAQFFNSYKNIEEFEEEFASWKELSDKFTKGCIEQKRKQKQEQYAKWQSTTHAPKGAGLVNNKLS
jgi:hypothetical protein